ncbi:MAG TPA: patatin-like phospholipase family protein [Pseudolabrys sp.]|jgi:predicted acylesterase/phospholipase RssA|nr:patatin-like phospholipase family protein [Pseudolabrys sp.]
MKRAITLAGGGPAAGLHIGVLEALDNAGIKFDVWALSCIGAWVGLVYNQCDPGKEVKQTYDFFRDGVFRDDQSYSRFPINSVFGSDSFANTRAMVEFFSSPESYENLWLPEKIAESAKETLAFMSDHTKWNQGDFNRWVLNDVLAVNPFIRYWASMMYLSNISGLSRIHYPESSFMKAIKFERLYENDKPFIFHNAWNITRQRLDLFSNKPLFSAPSGFKYGKITSASLCACSALPYVEETVQIGDDIYCEGALIDTVNFYQLLEDHPYIDEVWVNRIVDSGQVKSPRTIADALANLCMLFAATVGEDDIKLFKYHVKEENKWHGQIVEIEVSESVNFHWTRSNLDDGRRYGREAANRALGRYQPKKK